MNFTLFPYGFSKDGVYEYLGNVKNLEYFAFIVLPLVPIYALVRGINMMVFDCVKKKEEMNSLTPLNLKFNRTSGRLMSTLHVMSFLYGLSHFFHMGWLVTILWYPFWITLYIIKIFTEMYLIVISLFSISHYFLHYSLAKPSVELTQTCVRSGIRMVTQWLILKDLVLFIWLIVVLETGRDYEIERILDYYYGIHLVFQLLLFLSAFFQVRIIFGSQNSDIKPSHAEKLIYNQTLGIALFKLIMIPILLYLALDGVNNDVLSLCFITADLMIVPTVVQFMEVVCRQSAVQGMEKLPMGAF
ncbi:hypothetical protein CAEBREN_23926 [Caenorhabditis brenneri]|uniref:Uncharacterized protein n=1 Tax=Caenorhabditis brenneri TaxID=135651 RepID=G0M9U8_CAEBE|nr:hypothetical protein CAEBREN_23926 [Caenorhabditis brenneri]